MPRKLISTITLFVSGIFYLHGFAHAEAPKRQLDLFQELEAQDYSPEALRDALLQLRSADTRPALAQAIIISYYEKMSPTLTRGLIDQLSEKTRTLRANTPEKAYASYASNSVTSAQSYDGTNESLAQLLYEQQRVGDTYNSLSFPIPCHYFKRHPDVGILTQYVGMHNHRWAVPGFEIACHRDTSSAQGNTDISMFIKAGLSITARPPQCGTIHKDYAASRRIAATRSSYRPAELEKTLKTLSKGRKLPESLRDARLFDWALMDRQNYKTFQELEILFEAAKLETVEYYKTYFKYSAERARPIATAAILSQINQRPTRRRGHSRATDALLEGERKIRADILSGQNISDDNLETFKNTYPLSVKASQVSVAGFPQPLLHLAIGQPQTLIQMIDLGYDIEVKDTLGKTALMVAVQEDNFSAVTKLIEKGADVNAVSFHPDDIIANNPQGRHRGCGVPYVINTGERMPIHYALSDGSDAIVKLLIENGAKLDVLDSKGNTLLDYFNGTGPTQKNKKLSDSPSEVIAQKDIE